jgi:hypothetical protein
MLIVVNFRANSEKTLFDSKPYMLFNVIGYFPGNSLKMITPVIAWQMPKNQQAKIIKTPASADQRPNRPILFAIIDELNISNYNSSADKIIFRNFKEKLVLASY